MHLSRWKIALVRQFRKTCLNCAYKCSIWTISAHSGSLRNYTSGVMNIGNLICPCTNRNARSYKNQLITYYQRVSYLLKNT